MLAVAIFGAGQLMATLAVSVATTTQQSSDFGSGIRNLEFGA